MQIITLILSGLAFLAATTALALVLRCKGDIHKLAESVDHRFRDFATSNQKQKAALMLYVDQSEKSINEKVDDVCTRVNSHVKSNNSCFRGLGVKVNSVSERIEKLENEGLDGRIESMSERIEKLEDEGLGKKINSVSERIEKLENGCVPNFEEAKRAVNAVNDMNSGIANIFGFDPLDALKKSRQEAE